MPTSTDRPLPMNCLTSNTHPGTITDGDVI